MAPLLHPEQQSQQIEHAATIDHVEAMRLCGPAERKKKKLSVQEWDTDDHQAVVEKVTEPLRLRAAQEAATLAVAIGLLGDRYRCNAGIGVGVGRSRTPSRAEEEWP